MALESEELLELRELDRLPLADITPATKIAVQKGTERLKWVTFEDLVSYVNNNLP